MILVRYSSGLGNRLFMYSLGRILAEELNFTLRADPIVGFSGTFDHVGAQACVGGKEQILKDGKFHLHEILRDHTPRKVVLDGFFQQYNYFRAYKQKLRNSWLRPEEILLPFDPPHEEDLVMHVRRGDYVANHWALPFSYYESIIQEGSHRRVILITDQPQDPFFWRFKRYSATVLSLSTLESFAYMRKANKLALSASTFSWWAGFLSDASTIYFPKPYSGIWSDESNRQTGINLFVDDEDRYLMRKSGEPYTPNWVEALYQHTMNQLYRRPRAQKALKRLRLIHELEKNNLCLGSKTSVLVRQ